MVSVQIPTEMPTSKVSKVLKEVSVLLESTGSPRYKAEEEEHLIQEGKAWAVSHQSLNTTVGQWASVALS